MSGDIRREIGYSREGLDPGIHLGRPGVEIEIFDIPAANRSVRLGHVEERQVACPADVAVVLLDEVLFRYIVPVSWGGIGTYAVGPELNGSHLGTGGIFDCVVGGLYRTRHIGAVGGRRRARP